MSQLVRSPQQVRSLINLSGRAVLAAVFSVAVTLLSPVSALADPISAAVDFVGQTTIHLTNTSLTETATLTVIYSQVSTASVQPAGVGTAFNNSDVHGLAQTSAQTTGGVDIDPTSGSMTFMIPPQGVVSLPNDGDLHADVTAPAGVFAQAMANGLGMSTFRNDSALATVEFTVDSVGSFTMVVKGSSPPLETGRAFYQFGASPSQIFLTGESTGGTIVDPFPSPPPDPIPIAPGESFDTSGFLMVGVEVNVPVTPVPAVSEWGLVLMTLLALTTGAIMLRHRCC